ncbi:DELTA-stichotoxin-Hmg2b-like [Melanotaenia boesemani]|uniref:DELTA-stichotoxin-Hmg2b-like n=1 Tax=Melanotaenia boesemani TaxID=1250792 RepID=UPI001C044634|nr:DELTA-stichotoxin-Hmg2b-like [Melanotaenia boesemani]
MPESAESHSTTLTTNRNCTIEITNISSSFCLVNPKVHMESGFTFSPPQPTVRTTKAEVCSFTKDDNTATGAVGVLTYELFNMQQRHSNELMAIMFSVPFDYNFYKNWLGVGIFEHTRACDGKLFDLMYKSNDFTNFVRQQANGSGVAYQGRTLDLRACMSDEGKAIIKLEVYDKMGR